MLITLTGSREGRPAASDGLLWHAAMPRYSRLRHAVLACVLAGPVFAQAGEGGIDPNDSKPALAFLLAASNETISLKSSCNGNYGQRGPARIKDLLSTQLAYLYQGKIVIKGKCLGRNEPTCSVTINRDAGEDISSATFEFAVQKGRLQASSLHCVITP